jgi:hypothetical protein
MDSMKKELRDNLRLLIRYKEQLMARHASDPLKSPPVFLLNVVISDLEGLVKRL